MLAHTWSLLSGTTQILLKGVPRGIDLAELSAAIAGTNSLAGVHGLHVWSLSSEDHNLSAYVELADSAVSRPLEPRSLRCWTTGMKSTTRPFKLSVRLAMTRRVCILSGCVATKVN